MSDYLFLDKNPTLKLNDENEAKYIEKIAYALSSPERVAIMKNLPAKMVFRGQVFDVILWVFLCRDSFLKHLHSLQTPSVRFLLCGTPSVASCL